MISFMTGISSSKQSRKRGEGIGSGSQHFFGILRIICLTCSELTAWNVSSGMPEKNDRVCKMGRWVQITPDRLYLFGKKLTELTGKIYGRNIAWQDSVHGCAHHLTAQTKQFLGRIGTDNFFHTRTVSLRSWSVNLQHCDSECKSDDELQDWSYATVARHINVVAWPALFPGSSKARIYGLSLTAWQAVHVCPEVHWDMHCKHWLRQWRQRQLETLTKHRS